MMTLNVTDFIKSKLDEIINPNYTSYDLRFGTKSNDFGDNYFISLNLDLKGLFDPTDHTYINIEPASTKAPHFDKQIELSRVTLKQLDHIIDITTEAINKQDGVLYYKDRLIIPIY